MGAIYAELHVGGHVFVLRRCTYGVSQATNGRGRPIEQVRHGHVKGEMEVPRVQFMEKWAATEFMPVDGYVVFSGGPGEPAMETVSWEAGQCVFYREMFNKGSITDGSYICQWRIAAAKLVFSVGPPKPFVAAAPREHGTPPVPATGVKPMGSLALELVKLGLTPAEATYIKLDAHGLIDKTLLHQGASALAPVGGNYKALLAITDSGKTVEILTASTFETKTTLKPEVFGPVGYENEFDQMWRLEKADWIKSGRTLEQYKAQHPGYSHQNAWSGFRGTTLTPDETGGYGLTKGPNIQVILNTDYHGASTPAIRKVMASTLAHETYGHALFKIQGKRWKHGGSMAPGPGSDYNAPLQTQINHRADEAERNADRRPH